MDVQEERETTKPNNRKLAIIVSSIVGVLIVLGAAVYTSQSSKTDSISSITLSASDLATHNGKDGAKCYVAIDTTVYEINQGKKWKDGEHIPSEGQAYCGQDLSDVIGKSPHGKSILEILTKVGNLK